jgi:hypothetical protein
LFVFLQEVGSIIGKKGEIVKRFREEVQCKILICISFRILICKMTRLIFQQTFSINGTNAVTETEAHLLKPFDLVVILLFSGRLCVVFVRIFNIHTPCFKTSYLHII